METGILAAIAVVYAAQNSVPSVCLGCAETCSVTIAVICVFITTGTWNSETHGYHHVTCVVDILMCSLS